MRRSLQKARSVRASPGARPHDVRYYNILMFESPFAAVAFCRQVTDVATGRPNTSSATTGAHRLTLWITPTGLDDGSCYVYASDGALEAASTAGIDTLVVGYAQDCELPESKCPFVADTGELMRAERRAHSASLLALGLEAMARQHARRAGEKRDDASRAEVF
jgi:hypothetical protein